MPDQDKAAKTMIKIINGAKAGTTINVLYYPNKYTLTGKSSFTKKKVPGKPDNLVQFVGGAESNINMELFFDTYESKEDVREYTSKITDLLIPDPDLHEPPYFEFMWGPMPLGVACVLTSVTQNFTMFLNSGIPVRATLTVDISPRKSITEQMQQVTQQSSDRTKQKTLNQGDQLWMFADKEYKDPGMWREIAKANNIDNPRMLAYGKKIVIPRLEG